MSMASAPAVLHVEVQLKSAQGAFLRSDVIRKEVTDWLATDFVHLTIGQDIRGYDDLAHANEIASITVVDYSGSDSDALSHQVQNIHLDVQAFELHELEDDENHESKRGELSGVEDDEATFPLRITLLPNKALNRSWESSVAQQYQYDLQLIPRRLVFEDDLATRLLRFLTKMITITRNRKLDMDLMNWNRLILLYGSPGSGKTSLCRALAHKVTIRSSQYFSRGKLLEINLQSLHSKWFGESSRLIGRLFETIHLLADEESSLIVVLLDEVESVSGSRVKATAGNECGDALRATNQLLTSLDRLRYRHNVLVLCTSNLLTAIDSAFLDRVDIKQLIPNPNPQVIYEILRSSLNELVRVAVIRPSLVSSFVKPTEVDSVVEESALPTVDDQYIQSYLTMKVRFWNDSGCPARKLWSIAQNAKGQSGRSLRRLPLLAHALHIPGETCTMDECLEAITLTLSEQHLCMESV